MNVNYALNLYDKLEKTLGFNLGINYIKIRDNWCNSAYYHKSRKISLSSSLENRQEFKEHLYHEIGHRLYVMKRVPKHNFKIFTSGANDGYTKKEAQKMDDDGEPGPLGFISPYAMLNREEDWCETFSAFICNDRRTSGEVFYSTYYTILESDPLLKKKFQTVKRILEIHRNY